MGWGLHVRWERLRWPNQEIGRELVGAGRFELPTPCSRSKCATRLRYAPPDRQPEGTAPEHALQRIVLGEGGFITLEESARKRGRGCAALGPAGD